MPKQQTKGTKQLAVELDADLRDQISERAQLEGRKLRALVERAFRHYFRTVPLDDLGPGSTPAPTPSRRKGS
jgi:hypothetical protein